MIPFVKEIALELVHFPNEGDSYLLRGLAQGSLLCIGKGDVEISCIDSLYHKIIWAIRVEKSSLSKDRKKNFFPVITSTITPSLVPVYHALHRPQLSETKSGS